MSSQNNSNAASGLIELFSSYSEFNTQDFIIRQALSAVRTTTLVKVISCTNAGGVTPVGYVDVQVLVQRMDGAGNVIDAGIIHDVPYSRLQGGNNAVIMDPQEGDIGLVGISDRDISAVKASGAAAAPGSVRRHDMADAIYIGGILNGAPTQYVQFSTAGIALVSPIAINLQAPKVTIQAPAVAINSADVQIAGASFKHNGVNVGATHVHAGVTTGSGATLVPQ